MNSLEDSIAQEILLAYRMLQEAADSGRLPPALILAESADAYLVLVPIGFTASPLPLAIAKPTQGERP